MKLETLHSLVSCLPGLSRSREQRIRSRVALAVLLICWSVLPGAAQEYEGQTIVRPRLVADTGFIEPGKSFVVAVHFQIAGGWHIYWENAGDAGFPISVKFKVPPGFAVSPLRWPVPSRFEEADGMIGYGYQDETLLTATVRAPSELAQASVTITADLEWLTCEQLCIPGDATVSLQVPVGKLQPGAEAALVARFEKELPLPLDKGPWRVQAVSAVRETADRWLYSIGLQGGPGRVRHFFPRIPPNFTVRNAEVRLEGTTVIVPLESSAPGLQPASLSGILVTDQGSYDLQASAVSRKSLQGGETSRDEVASVPGVPPSLPPAVRDDPRVATGPDDGSSTPMAVEGALADVPPGGRQATGAAEWLDRPFRIGGGDEAQSSLLLFLLLGFIGGLLLNITPCVLPVISIKILSFINQANESRAKTRLLGVVYGAGVLLSLWVMAVAVILLRAAGEGIGWGFQFQSPYFVVAIGAVVFLFALNLFGVYEFRAPGFRGPMKEGGTTGAFLNGILATVLATPCTAPFLGTAVGFAFSQSGLVTFLVFTAVALGLALPYVLLSWFPQWLKFLPRPGMWMVRFKQAMGFLLLAALVWLLSVLGSQMGSDGIVWTCVFLLALAAATWMIGQMGFDAPRRRRWAVWGVAALLAGSAYYWSFEHELRWREDSAAIPETTGVGRVEGELHWLPFSLADLERRVSGGENVFVDFTADWCWNCKVNERTVLASRSVLEAFERHKVTPVKADWTRRNPEITRLLAKFGRSGVPFYVIFPAGKLTEPVALSEVLTPAMVVKAFAGLQK